MDLKISDVRVKLENGDVFKSTETVYITENEIANFLFEKNLPVSDATLEMNFEGELNNKMKGFYRSKYFTTDMKERYGAVTQFEATDARRCFPCWDEPAVKATFDISMTIPQDRVGLSNMPQINEALLDNNLKTLKFSTSPIMSTYLVALVVGEFDFVEGKSLDGVQIRVFTPVGKKVQGEFALEVATKALPYFKDYFRIPYPLPKLDLIAIADFAAGAMEHWGIVTYRFGL